MYRTLILTVLTAGLVLGAGVAPAWAAQLEIVINPNSETSDFKMTYQKTIFIEYPNGGDLYDILRDKSWTVSGTADSANPGVQNLMAELNRGIAADGSQAVITDLDVDYTFSLTARDILTSIDSTVVLEGTLSRYVITQDSQRSLVDLGWRGLSTDRSITIDGTEINIPLDLIMGQEPEVYAFFEGTDAEEVLGKHIIDADFILRQPLSNWHFLFDPTGISVDAGLYGISDEIAGFVVSSWTMGESSFREGIVETGFAEVDIVLDQPYGIRSVHPPDTATLRIIGFGSVDTLDGVEIVGVTPTPPEGTIIDTGDFSVFIIYGMAGVAAIAGIIFFFISNRSLKNEKVGQQGIDPTRLVGYETSDSSGGYKTNRGEAQLRDDSDYQQTRSYYDNTSQPQSPPPQASSPAAQEPACGCAASADMGSECDCVMQGACLCDGTCQCGDDICKEHTGSMR